MKEDLLVSILRYSGQPLRPLARVAIETLIRSGLRLDSQREEANGAKSYVTFGELAKLLNAIFEPHASELNRLPHHQIAIESRFRTNRDSQKLLPTPSKETFEEFVEKIDRNPTLSADAKWRAYADYVPPPFKPAPNELDLEVRDDFEIDTL